MGIIGSSGYAGLELVRILLRHPQVDITYLASRTYAGQRLADVAGAFNSCTDLVFEPLDPQALAVRCDVVLAAVPHGVGMELAGPVLENGCRFIDLGADFRLPDAAVYQTWYGRAHTAAHLLPEAVYGLPEFLGGQVKEARLVANPGCYPTSVLLGIGPLVKAGLIDLSDVVVSSMSGVSGAGSTPKSVYHFPECTENVQAYKVAEHQHTPEIEQGIARIGSGAQATVSFTPHLVPMMRGILSTLVLRPVKPVKQEALQTLYRQTYAQSPFVRVLANGDLPRTKSVWGTNFCDIAVRVDERAGKILVVAAIDNLVKGAAGQAVQNMNLMFGLPETSGLLMPGLYP